MEEVEKVTQATTACVSCVNALDEAFGKADEQDEMDDTRLLDVVGTHPIMEEALMNLFQSLNNLMVARRKMVDQFTLPFEGNVELFFAFSELAEVNAALDLATLESVGYIAMAECSHPERFAPFVIDSTNDPTLRQGVGYHWALDRAQWVNYLKCGLMNPDWRPLL